MAYNNKFYRGNYRGPSTFQNALFSVPPPPLPPPFFMPPVPQKPQITDQEFLKTFENTVSESQPTKQKPAISISKVREELCEMVTALNKLKEQQKKLTEKVNDLTDQEWSLHLKEIEVNKAIVNKLLVNINPLNVDVLRRLLVKRSAKRARQKRQRIEKKIAKQEQIKKNKENSRKIDEFLQKFQDDIKKARQEEEAKLQADIILRETLRKKQDAKKYLVKLDALVKLRKARQNTAKGRGQPVSDSEAEVFHDNIEKLKTMWTKQLSIYEKEEADLRAKLKLDAQETTVNVSEQEVSQHIDQWKQLLFGGTLPQVDFHGDVSRFIAVRSQWDMYLSAEGTSMPIGWVPPTSS